MSDSLRLYIYKKYGFNLSEEEIEEVKKWFDDNSSKLVNEEITDTEIEKYLHERFKGRTKHIIAEDLSNMNYLLALLKENSGK